MDDDIFRFGCGQFQMLLKGDRLGGHFSVIAQIRFDRFRRGRAKRCFTDLLFSEAARQMMVVQTLFRRWRPLSDDPLIVRSSERKSSPSSLTEVGWIPTTA